MDKPSKHREHLEEDSEKTPTVWGVLSEQESAEDEQKRREEEQKRREEEQKKQAKKLEDEAEKKKKHEEAEREQQEQKERKRKRAIKRSRQLIEELNEHDHAELSPLQAVRLLVAERVSWLGSRFYNEEDLDEHQLHVLGHHLDFLSSLSDKIEDPDSEATPEIEVVYQQIIEAISNPETAEATNLIDPHSQIDGLNDQILTAIAENTHPETEHGAIPESESEEEHRGHAAAIALAISSLAVACQSLGHSRRGSGTTQPSAGGSRVGATVGSGRASTSAPPPPPPEQVSSNQAATPTAPAPSAHRAVDQPAAMPTVHPEVPPATAETWTNSAQQASSRSRPERMTVGESRPSYKPQEATPAATYRSSEPRLEYPPTGDRPTTATAPRQPIEARPSATPEASIPSTPVEMWSIGDMLNAAQIIPLGHGNYLKTAFTRGEIDREGMMKVIKDWRKGNNYMPTFEKGKAAVASRKRGFETPQQNSHTPTANPPAQQPNTAKPAQSPPNSGSHAAPSTTSQHQTTPVSLAPPEQNTIDSAQPSPLNLHLVIAITVILVLAAAIWVLIAL